MALFKKQLSPEQALQKLKHFCGYQERCHLDVIEKLYGLGVRKNEHGGVIASLIGEGYLNEERFALAYAGGKFRINHWGKQKIKYGLKQKQISEYCIKKALKSIDDQQYLEQLQKLAAEKYGSLKNEQYLIRRKKTMDYLIQRGFENSMVESALNNIPGKDRQ